MAVIETLYPAEELHEVPMPGSIPHLEYMAQLETADIRTLQDLQGFLFDNLVCESFTRLIIKHRTFFPLPAKGHMTLDSRLIPGRPSPEPVFRAAIHLDETHCKNTLLTIHGRPNPSESRGYDDYTYDIAIPLTNKLELNFSRPLEANYARGNVYDLERWDSWSYNSMAFAEYGQDDPAPFICAIQEAAHDLAQLIRYANGERLAA